MKRQKPRNGSIVADSILDEIKSNHNGNGNGVHSNGSVLSALKTVPKSKKEKKVKYQLLLKNLLQNVKLKENQLEYSKKIEKNTITFVTGAAGSSKTYTACYTLLKLLFEEKIDKIICTKPIQESGENLGFLPGDLEQKLAPYMESFILTCTKLIGEEATNYLFEQKLIEARPLAFMRGATFDRAGMFLDEMQNARPSQIILYITRLGEDSKIVLAGDVSQTDIKHEQIFSNNFIKVFENVESIAFHKFSKEDIVRNKILIQITENYEKWKDTNNKS